MAEVDTGAESAEKKQPAIRGVFSTKEIRKVGTGTTTRKTVQKTFWFVEQAGDMLECQPLNPNFVPSGPRRKISMDELMAKFAPEPEFYQMSVYPAMKQLNQTVKQGDAHREKGETFSAEFEYSRALKVDEENVRANFGIGLTYLERGEKEKAQNIFERIVKLDGAYEPAQKHLFNEFGINLRKNRMFEQAVEYYQRALELTRQDENLHTNLARALFETGNVDGCLEHLFRALELAPGHDVSVKFLEWLKKKSLIPQDKLPLAENFLSGESPEKVAETAEKAAPAPPNRQEFSLDLDLDL